MVRIAVALVAFAVLARIPVGFDVGFKFDAALAVIWAFGLLSLVLLTGYVGQISLCQATFAGVGAYTAGLMVAGFHADYLVAVVAGVAAAFVLGVIVGIPALRLRGITLAIVMRMVRATMLEVLQSPFINAARAHGISPRRLLFRHALPAALNPLISLFGFSIAGLLSASLLVEVVVSWPGLGPLLFEAILGRDLYVVIGAILFSTMFLVVGTLVSDLLLFAADPRIRAQ